MGRGGERRDGIVLSDRSAIDCADNEGELLLDMLRDCGP